MQIKKLGGQVKDTADFRPAFVWFEMVLWLKLQVGFFSTLIYKQRYSKMVLISLNIVGQRKQGNTY